MALLRRAVYLTRTAPPVFMGPDGPARCGGSMVPVLVSIRLKLLAAALTREATLPPRPALSFPGPTSTSGHRVHGTRWVSTELPNPAIPQGRPLAAWCAARAALPTPRSRPVISATSSTTTIQR